MSRSYPAALDSDDPETVAACIEHCYRCDAVVADEERPGLYLTVRSHSPWQVQSALLRALEEAGFVVYSISQVETDAGPRLSVRFSPSRQRRADR